MASWPGVSRTRLSPMPSTGDPWADNRSEIYLPRSTSLGSSLDQWNEVGREQRLASSTASGTLQPLCPHLSETSPLKITSTAPHTRQDLAEDNGESEHAGNSSTTWTKEQQWPLSLPSSQHSHLSSHEAVHARNNTSAKLEKLLDEVLSIHEEVSAQRYRARDMRHALRHKRDEEDDLRLALRNRLNLISPENLHEETSAIHKAIEDLQTVTAAYLVLEADYHKVEDELGEREYILEKRMRRMQNTLRRQAPNWTQHFYDDFDSDLSDDSFSTSDADPVSSRTAEYLSYIGEVRMLRERLSELEAEYLSLIDQQQLRERIGISLDNESLDFIARYEGEKAQIETELSLALHRVRSHPEYKEQSDNEALDRRWRQVLEQYLPEPPEEPPIPDPLRLSEFEDRSSFFESARPLPLNKATFVNRWLLHRLRHSGMEILQFKSQPELLELMDYGWDSDSISQMALMLWFRDETASMAPARSHSGG